MCSEFFNQISTPCKRLLVLALILWIGALGIDRIFQAGINYQNLAHWQKPYSTNDTISVSGQGKVTAIPDIGTIDVSVQTRGQTVNQVQTDSTKKMNDIDEYLKSMGIEKKDLQTTNYSLSPIYSYDPNNGKQNFDGYSLSQTLTVKIRALDKASDILGGVIDKGANNVSQLKFTVDDPEALKTEARLKAIAQAKEKAQALAEATGVKLGKVKSFNENSNNPTPYPTYYSRDMAMGVAESKTVAPAVEAGSQQITVDVTLSYEIE